MATTELLLRLALSFLTLLVLTRLMGRKEISQMTFFNFVSGISIGTIGATMAISKDLSIVNGVTALAGWSLFTIALGFIDIKSRKMRKTIEGEPLVVIQNGMILEGALRKVRLDVDALRALLRQKNVFSLADVEYAIFETDGNLSVMKRENKQPATKGDMKVPPQNKSASPIPVEVISDGRIIHSNLAKLNLSSEWLEQQLAQAGAASSDVFLAEVQPDGTLYIDRKGITH
ncbi:DUF421 domain-containing protein [Paenibacillus sp. TRM 82003]|nr:DUF421 domain-containing protein [Paenibacillus sp. TRM 82003]